jgi:NDP-sugar pyrophosphorylase family protein
MELAAIIVVGARQEEEQAAGNNHHAGAENFAGIPLALLDVVGKSVVHHVADRLRRAGVEAVTALTPEALADDAALRDGDSRAACLAANDLWRAAEDAFSGYAGEGAENVLLLRLGPYAEFDISDLLQFHLQQRQNATLVQDGEGAIEAAVVQSARRNDAAFLLRNRLRATRLPSHPYVTGGYVNRLQKIADLRRLAQDALLMRCYIRPAGREIKPGVWVGERARIHRSARVLAPAFIGAQARLRAASVVTRCSVVEHHSEVDCGTVLEDTTILPYTYLGSGLDASHTVAGFGKIAHLQRQAEVEITDPRLLDNVTTSASWRTVKNAASLAGYLPVQAIRGILRAGRRTPSTALEPPPLSTGLRHPSPLEPSSEPVPASNQFAGDFAVVRRYGNE